MVTSSNGVPHGYPTDMDRGVLDGPQQEHILVLGDRSVINRGVSSNELSVAAHLAREHQRSTRNGACWLVLPVPQNVAANAPQTLERNQDLIIGTDLFVVMIGHTDALALTPAGEWERHLTATLDAAREMLPRDARVVLAEIPRLEAPTRWGRFGRQERHRNRLNRIIQRHTGTGSTTRTMARLAALPSTAIADAAARERFSVRYAQWAQAITAALATPDRAYALSGFSCAASSVEQHRGGTRGGTLRVAAQPRRRPPTTEAGRGSGTGYPAPLPQPG